MVLTVFVYHFLVADFVLVMTFPFEGVCMFYAWCFRFTGQLCHCCIHMKVEDDIVIDNQIADGHDVVVWMVAYMVDNCVGAGCSLSPRLLVANLDCPGSVSNWICQDL